MRRVPGTSGGVKIFDGGGWKAGSSSSRSDKWSESLSSSSSLIVSSSPSDSTGRLRLSPALPFDEGFFFFLLSPVWELGSKRAGPMVKTGATELRTRKSRS